MAVSRSRRLRGVTPEQVWELIRPAGAALHAEHVERAWVEPGTGPGVGEVQAFVVRREGASELSRVRVVAEEPPCFAETETLDSWPPSGATYDVRACRGGTRLTFTLWVVDVPGESGLDLRTARDCILTFLDWVQSSLRPSPTLDLRDG